LRLSSLPFTGSDSSSVPETATFGNTSQRENPTSQRFHAAPEGENTEGGTARPPNLATILGQVFGATGQAHCFANQVGCV
jgi:hypothetical protein